MKGPFFTLDEARAAAQPGDEIWARNNRGQHGWCVMTKDEADEEEFK